MSCIRRTSSLFPSYPTFSTTPPAISSLSLFHSRPSTYIDPEPLKIVSPPLPFLIPFNYIFLPAVYVLTRTSISVFVSNIFFKLLRFFPCHYSYCLIRSLYFKLSLLSVKISSSCSRKFCCLFRLFFSLLWLPFEAGGQVCWYE